MARTKSIVSKLHADARRLLAKWLSGKEPVCSANQPVQHLRRLLSTAWIELIRESQEKQIGVEEHLRSEILKASTREVSMFVPMILQILRQKLKCWEIGEQFLPFLSCKCADAQACLALIRPSIIPGGASHIDFQWPEQDIYEEYAKVWNKKLSAYKLIDLAGILSDRLENASSLENEIKLIEFWKSRELPLIGVRLWKLLPPGVKLELLRYKRLNSLLNECLSGRLLKEFTSVRKDLAEYIGVSEVPDLRIISTDNSLLSRMKVIAIRKELASSNRWTTMENPDVMECISQISRDSDSRLLGIMQTARPEVRVWFGMVRGKTNLLAEFNELPIHTFKKLLGINSVWLFKVLHQPVSVNGEEAIETFFKRLIRIGRVTELLSALSSYQATFRVISIFMGLWHLWHPKLPLQISTHFFDSPRTYAFFKGALSQPQSRYHLIRMLRRLTPERLIGYLEDSGDWFFENISPLEASLSALGKYAWPSAKGLLRTVFEHSKASGLDPYSSEDDLFFWVNSNLRFRKLLDALSGQLTVGEGLDMLAECVEFLNSRNAKPLLKLKLQNGRKLGDYVLDSIQESDEYEGLLLTGGKFWLARMFRRNPEKYFYSYFKEAGLRSVLPEAFRNKTIGKMVDQLVTPGDLLGELGWVRSNYHKRPTSALAYETALLLGVRYAPALVYLAIHRFQGPEPTGRGRSFEDFYQEKIIRKKRGGSRILKIPNPLLKCLQRQVLNRGLVKIDLPGSVHGFRPGRNLVTNASLHAGKEIVVNADIRDFFPNTTRDAAFQTCLGLANGNISPQSAGFIADLCCQGGVLPTGAPTSPAISNLVLGQVDRSLEKACQAKEVDYTRYADDLTFSGGQEAIKMLGFATRLLDRKGYQIHPDKVNIFRRGRRQMVTGLAVNEKPTLPRSVRRSIRAAVHAASAGRKVFWKGVPASRQVLRGLLAHLAMTRRHEARSYTKQLEECGYFKKRNLQDSVPHEN